MSTTSQDVLLSEFGRGEQDTSGSTRKYGVPTAPILYSWKDSLMTIGCTLAFAVAFRTPIFEPTIATPLGQTKEFIAIGLYVTLMGWCAQLALRRLFSAASIGSKMSTLQSIDGILRSNPCTDRADRRLRSALLIMLAMSPTLSIACKTLGDGESAPPTLQNETTTTFSLEGPNGTQTTTAGFGLSPFINATLPPPDLSLQQVMDLNIDMAE